VSTSKKTIQAKITALEPESTSPKKTPDWLTESHAPIERKIERDRSNLRAAGFDYDDFVDHLLELIAVLSEGDKADPGIRPKSKNRITATQFRGSAAKVLSLKLRIK
jgi:hypothetical protein